MQQVNKVLVRYMLLLALLLIVAVPGLFYFDSLCWGESTALRQALSINALTSGSFAWALLLCVVYRSLLKRGDKGLLLYYMASKMLTLLLAALTLVVYGFVVGTEILPFVINLLLLYIIFLAVTSCMYAAVEKKQKNRS